ncbi:MAG: hypothetical protein JO252_04540 [Planctomycetaceae bacterium]|nr:hypothetical protein [Planctomycetaceae bacterium]MBV8557031.1 hypothetical protein [Planctomycetaceae bacterium]MBV8610610.1 hypothetical protein [Singulisphaera sp.]
MVLRLLILIGALSNLGAPPSHPGSLRNHPSHLPCVQRQGDESTPTDGRRGFLIGPGDQRLDVALPPEEDELDPEERVPTPALFVFEREDIERPPAFCCATYDFSHRHAHATWRIPLRC